MAAVLSLCGSLLFFLPWITWSRKVSVQLNPGALAPPPGGDVVHVRAQGDNDTLHFLFCSQGAPTLLMVHTNISSSTLLVDWPVFLSNESSGSVKVEPGSNILDSRALVFTRVLEYNDVNNTAQVTSDLYPPYDLHNISWSPVKLDGTSVLLCARLGAGLLCLKLSAFESEGRAKTWPRLLHSANSSQLEVWLDGLHPRAERSRFFLELQTVGGAYPLDSVAVRRSIDDEFTPSIFQVSQWTSATEDSSRGRGFVLWKPVAYRRSPPTLEDATPCRHSRPRPTDGQEVAAASRLVRAFFSQEVAYGLNVTFGLAGGAFYNSSRFLTWTLLVGVGLPPADTFSPLLLAIMAAGLGVPLLILLMGGVYVCTRAPSASSVSRYQPIN
ncbi:glycosylated lysosomal membrane protein-like isoform X1 [Nerophis ophidion]|uniref:glycosylated lysosomal membrane protein-like isoform X1 n=2 Tax=Nerophis ophidion TaxID=159077 RepID=UPI002ADF0077|nr:glycosylated lysosomal membrane protein-like isoform X1 [Nerophis ophidion]XP_061752621.1 glycosylated lysosomal membrane protein-like isoform X1 [Nerophis ophidion]